MKLEHDLKFINVFENTSLVDLYPIQFGYEACLPTHSVPISKYNNYLFHYVAEGSGYLHSEKKGHNVKVESNSGFLILPDMVSNYRADTDNPWKYYWIEFNGIKAKRFLKEAGLDLDNQIYEVIDQEAHKKIIKTFENLLKNAENSEAYIISQVYLLMDTIIKNSKNKVSLAEPSSIKNFYIKEAISYITNNFHKHITVKEIANHCNLNRSYLTRLFKNEFDMTLSNFLHEIKLKKASELLLNQELTVEEVADLIGYANQFSFSTAFKNYYGFSPSEWRNR